MRYIKDFVIYVGSSYYNPDTEDYLDDYGIPFVNGQAATTSAVATVSSTQGASGRYLAIVFKNSRNEKEGFIDLWELIPYGYVPSMAD